MQSEPKPFSMQQLPKVLLGVGIAPANTGHVATSFGGRKIVRHLRPPWCRRTGDQQRTRLGARPSASIEQPFKSPSRSCLRSSSKSTAPLPRK